MAARLSPCASAQAGWRVHAGRNKVSLLRHVSPRATDKTEQPQSQAPATTQQQPSTDAQASSSAVEEVPIWEIREAANKKVDELESSEPPAILWLGWAVISAIVAVGCLYEYVNEKALFRILEPTSPLWRPAVTFLFVSGTGTAFLAFKEGLALYNLQEKRKDEVLKTK